MCSVLARCAGGHRTYRTDPSQVDNVIGIGVCIHAKCLGMSAFPAFLACEQVLAGYSVDLRIKSGARGSMSHCNAPTLMPTAHT
eukprot:5653429-Amphidinium_carterae.1